mmetsp:Transcript_22982/g.77652  ORF Transcript_22982/g.77652 Transcript_22982/m.77652 type:complete len:257 (+) Transcript_22982:595-1365(+)
MGEDGSLAAVLLGAVVGRPSHFERIPQTSHRLRALKCALQPLCMVAHVLQGRPFHGSFHLRQSPALVLEHGFLPQEPRKNGPSEPVRTKLPPKVKGLVLRPELFSCRMRRKSARPSAIVQGAASSEVVCISRGGLAWIQRGFGVERCGFDSGVERRVRRGVGRRRVALQRQTLCAHALRLDAFRVSNHCSSNARLLGGEDDCVLGRKGDGDELGPSSVGARHLANSSLKPHRRFRLSVVAIFFQNVFDLVDVDCVL